MGSVCGIYGEKRNSYMVLVYLAQACDKNVVNLQPHPLGCTRFLRYYRKLLAGKPSANLYDIYHCCVHSGILLVMDRGNVWNM